MSVTVDSEESLLFKTLPEMAENAPSSYSGAYWSDELQRELQISVEENEIIASWTNDETRTSGTLVSINEAVSD